MCEGGVCVEDTSYVAVEMRIADNLYSIHMTMRVADKLYSSTASGPPSPLFEKEERRL